MYDEEDLTPTLLRELDALVALELDATPSPPDRARLQELLLGSRAARWRYVQHVNLHARMILLDEADSDQGVGNQMLSQFLAGNDPDVAETIQDADAAKRSLKVDIERRTGTEPSTRKFGPFDFDLSPMPRRLYRNSNSDWRYAALSVAAAIALVCGIVGWWYARRPDQQGLIGGAGIAGATQRAQSDDTIGNLDSSSTGAEYYAIVTALTPNTVTVPPVKVGASLTRQSLIIDQGIVQLLSWQGASIAIEGPAKLEIDGLERMDLKYGRLRADVPQPAIGLTINTPDIELIDLGTEFGVNVANDREQDIHVFTGAVLARVASDRNHGGVLRLTENQGISFTPQQGVISSLEVSDAQFSVAPKVKDNVAPPLSISKAYVDAILASRPKSYWRFDSITGEIVRNEITGRADLQMSGAVSIRQSSPGNATAVFSTSGKARSLRPRGELSMQSLDTYSVEMAFCPAWRHAGQLYQMTRALSGDGEIDPKSTMSFLQLHGCIDYPQDVEQTIRFCDREPPGPMGGHWLLGRYEAARWSHVVVVRTDQELAMYMDGTCVKRIAHKQSRHDVVPLALQFGCHTGAAPWDHRFFHGEIDEIALYDRGLGDDEIADHYHFFRDAVQQGQTVSP